MLINNWRKTLRFSCTQNLRQEREEVINRETFLFIIFFFSNFHIYQNIYLNFLALFLKIKKQADNNPIGLSESGDIIWLIMVYCLLLIIFYVVLYIALNRLNIELFCSGKACRISRYLLIFNIILMMSFTFSNNAYNKT